jgi:hypothetical protein
MPAPTPTTLQLELTPEELELLCEALDSHVYWQLSDPAHRDSGTVRGPGSEDEAVAEEIQRVETLAARVSLLARTSRGQI